MSENVFCPNCGTPAVHRSRVAPFSANSISSMSVGTVFRE
jgi:hypothetical protein